METNDSGPTLYTYTHTHMCNIGCYYFRHANTHGLLTELIMALARRSSHYHRRTAHPASSTQSRLEVSNRKNSIASEVNPNLKTQSAVRKRQNSGIPALSHKENVENIP